MQLAEIHASSDYILFIYEKHIKLIRNVDVRIFNLLKLIYKFRN